MRSQRHEKGMMGERLRVKEGVVRDSGCCCALRVGWGNLPEAGKTDQGAGLGPGGGRENKSPIVLGELSGGLRQAGVSSGVCVCVCEALGRRPRGAKGSESSWLAGWAPPTPGPRSGRLGVEGSAQPENW